MVYARAGVWKEICLPDEDKKIFVANYFQGKWVVQYL
jgi:hypothetical protein